MKNYFYIIIFLSSISLSHGMTRKSDFIKEELRQNVHGAAEALNKSRFDLATELGNNAANLTTPPKKPIKITEIPNTVVLPKKDINKKIVTVDSNEYVLLLKDRKLAKQFAEENKTLRRQNQEVDKAKQLQEQINNEIVKENNNLKIENSKLKAFKGFVIKIVSGVLLGVFALFIIWLAVIAGKFILKTYSPF